MATKAEITAFLERDFPQCKCTVDACGDGAAIVRRRVGDAELRPGGTVSGPVMMDVADTALYVALLAELGLVPMAVTTSLNINFLRKPTADRDVIGIARLLKVGKTLVVGDVTIHSDGIAAPVAHASVTYAIPPSTAAAARTT